MPTQTTTTAQIKCSFGLAPSVFNATPRPTMSSNLVPGVITDNVPMMNIPPFGMCTTPSNPVVASIIASSLGTVTQAPCVPATVAPWAPGSTTTVIGNIPETDNTCKLMCMWGGVITFVSPGQTTHNIP